MTNCLTVAEAQRESGGAGGFEAWPIPKTRRITTFGDRAEVLVMP